MNKDEAAKYLGVSVKTLNNYLAKKLVGVSYIKGKHGQEAKFEQAELDRFLNQSAEPTHSPALVRMEPTLPQPSLTLPNPTLEGIVPSNLTNNEMLFSIFQSIADSLKSKDQLLLSVEDVARLLNLSPGRVNKLIKDGAITAIKFGRSWRIKRTDLEIWVEGL